ncbi:MAG: dihydropteroate synthase [Caldisericaceae bacterium]
MIARYIKKDYLLQELVDVGIDPQSLQFFIPKAETLIFKLHDVDARGANILKQEFLSAGGDVAINKHVASFKTEKTDIITIGTPKVYKTVIDKLTLEPYFGLKEVKVALLDAITQKKMKPFTIKGRVFDFEKDFFVMGILNVTPDSFSDGGKYTNLESALKRTEEMVNEGVDIIDVGGESTRPNAEPVSIDEELKRVIPIINELSKRFPTIPISIDTYKAKVAEEAINSGADIINDISGLRFDENMVDIAKRYDTPVVVMHIKGTPKNMQKNPTYENLMKELLEYFDERIKSLNSFGISKIIIDPGIGFGKTREHNLTILNRLSEFKIFNVPILMGLSRKSFIGLTLDRSVDDRLFGTIASNAFALLEGASILRVHDVKPHVDLIKMIKAIKKEGN